MQSAGHQRASRTSSGHCLIEPLESRCLLSTTFYVSPRGKDSNDGLSVKTAWKTIQNAMDQATPGSTVLVMPGVYNQKLSVDVSGNATDGYITFKADGHATINGRNQPGQDIISISGKSYVQIIGFNITGDLGVTDGAGIYLNGADSNINILDNTIHQMHGIQARAIAAYGYDQVTGITNLDINGNNIYDCQPANSETLTLDGNVSNFQIENNYIHNVNNIGIDCIGGEQIDLNPANDFARDGVVSGNRVTRVHFTGTGRDGAGIFIDGAQNVVVTQNTCWRDDVGIEVNAVQSDGVATNVNVSDNYVFNNNGPGISIGASQQNDGVVQSCQVTNNTLFHDGLHDTTDGELRLQFGTNNLIENNIVDASRNVVLLDGQLDTTGDTSDYNLYFVAGSPAAAQFTWDGFPYSGLNFLQATSQQDAHSIFANPLIIGAGTLRPHMSLHSPAVNAGNPGFVPASGETDFYGHPRVLGTAVDIGAIEIA